MKLFYANGTCAIGIHFLLEEAGLPYETQRIDFAKSEQSSPGYLAINPKGKVPALQRDDGSVLTEFPAIAGWIGRSNPALHLIPAAADDQARVQEVIDYAVGTVHMQGFSRIARPENFSPDAGSHEAVKAKGRQIFDQGLTVLDAEVGANPHVFGQLSIADAALFYIEFWAAARLKQALPANLAAHYARMTERPAAQRVLSEHGWPVSQPE